ncbi:AAA family ATPase [Candidatus Desantisbacteria bacterium]|nr:AAA family ATPase [Candidatus Desantisbacteria bacterium]
MNPTYNDVKLKEALTNIFNDTHLKMESPSSDFLPLFLLMDIKPYLIAFASLYENPQKDYNSAFQKLKELYTIRSKDWADFDLNLVLCRMDKNKSFDNFFNEVEINPYFCRKFIINGNNKIEDELEHLPFIPLRPENIGLKRPLSAQTFLMKHGVKTELAKSFAVPHFKGIEKIIEESLKGKFETPNWFESETGYLNSSQFESKINVRIKELEISNFRAYKNQKFDLDADLVVLYGSNGLGKTSFFDAIDFMCTGGVTRFDKRKNKLESILKHLDSSEKESFVKMTISENNQNSTFERYVNNRMNVNSTENFINRIDFLKKLTGVEEESHDMRIENLVNLFRSIHIFGQEYQSLTSQIKDDSTLPEDVVSRMLAFQDYVEGINKTKKVSEVLERQVNAKGQDIVKLKDLQASKEEEIKQLTQQLKHFERPDAVLELGKQMFDKISHEIKISIEPPKEFSEKIVRGLDAEVIIAKGDVSFDIKKIEEIETEFPKFIICTEKVNEKKIGLKQRKELIEKNEEEYIKNKKELVLITESHQKLLLEEKHFNKIKENFDWIANNKAQYDLFKVQIDQEIKNFQEIQKQLIILQTDITKTNSEIEIKQDSINKIILDKKMQEDNLNKIISLMENLNDWNEKLNRIIEIEKNIHELEIQIFDLKKIIPIQEDSLKAKYINIEKLRTFIKNLQKNGTELQGLLDSIEKHISNEICPVCGTSHKSQQELIEKLKLQRGVRPKETEIVLKEFNEMESKHKKMKEQVDSMNSKLKNLEENYIKFKKELSDTKEKLKIYEHLATSLNLPVILKNLTAIIFSKKIEIENSINLIQKELSKQQVFKDEQFNNSLMYIGNKKEFEQKLSTTKLKIKELHLKLNNIKNDALERQVSLEIENSSVHETLNKTVNDINNLKEQLESAQFKSQNLQKQIDSSLERKKVLEKEILEINGKIVEYSNCINEVEKLFKYFKFNITTDIEQIQNKKKKLNKKLARLEVLQNEITNFQFALDSMQKSVAIKKSETEIKEREKQLEKLKLEKKSIEEWLLYVNRINKELQAVQNKSLKEYTHKYGPLTSIIQKRLRSVYGFGNIELSTDKGGILVHVEREASKKLFPSDYFSESQIQIVMLSLFLTATLTQTWSSFSPILLDDPVTHFDDLNAYSLLDVIKGLILDNESKHQFIISTCEERLFRLMRQKFSRMKNRAIFYEFKSIGDNGPEIEMYNK